MSEDSTNHRHWVWASFHERFGAIGYPTYPEWIEERIQKWKKSRGYSVDYPLTQEDHDDFDSWLSRCAKDTCGYADMMELRQSLMRRIAEGSGDVMLSRSEAVACAHVLTAMCREQLRRSL